MHNTPSDLPPVSIVLPCRNERRWIRDCLDSLVGQDYPNVTEIVVVDGESNDGTTDIAVTVDPKVRIVDNPGLTAASAMNLGLAAAENDLIVRVDAHTIYEPDYVSASVRALLTSGADWVGGPMRPVGISSFGKAVAAVTSSPVGVGPGRFHYATTAQDVETVYLGIFDRRIVQEVGGYDDQDLQYAAEDQELNYRLRLAGRRIRLDPSIRSWYFPRQDAKALWRQYSNYGMCKASTLKKHRSLPYWRPLVPPLMVLATVTAFITGAATRHPVRGAIPAAGYAAGVGVAAANLARQDGVAPHQAAAALTICHWGYGLGFLKGLVRIVQGRPFDNRPG